MTVTQPDWVEALKRPASYMLKSSEEIKLLETTTSYLFRADDWLYKIKKMGNEIVEDMMQVIEELTSFSKGGSIDISKLQNQQTQGLI